MTDVGRYAAMEAEVIAAIGSISGVVSVEPSTSVEDLVETEGIRTPVIGVIEGESSRQGAYALSNRRINACSEWEVAVVVRNERGRAAARARLREILEKVRDNLHYASSAQPPTAKYIWKGDKRVQVEGDDLYAAIATFELTVLLQS
jgi:hypothetical protein